MIQWEITFPLSYSLTIPRLTITQTPTSETRRCDEEGKNGKKCTWACAWASEKVVIRVFFSYILRRRSYEKKPLVDEREEKKARYGLNGVETCFSCAFERREANLLSISSFYYFDTKILPFSPFFFSGEWRHFSFLNFCLRKKSTNDQ